MKQDYSNDEKLAVTLFKILTDKKQCHF